jgi:hypothetical protein
MSYGVDEKRIAQRGANPKICEVLVSISSHDIFSVSSAVATLCSVCACVRVFLCGVAPWLLGGRDTTADNCSARISINKAVSLTHSLTPVSCTWPSFSLLVGYTMRDIRYKWNEGPNSVGVSNEVSLPQFKVLGHRQRAMEISLTTGIS